MASTWGDSWGTSWLDSWGTTTPIPVADEPVIGGGSSKRGRKYPRWVIVNGERFYVKNAEEERRLLRALQERAEEAAKIAAALGDDVLAKEANRRAVRIAKRQKTVDEREQEWLQRLQDEDEEILLLFG